MFLDSALIEQIDEWLDRNTGEAYKEAPLAQDWARVCKVIEELGEAIQELILATGQNPRKLSDSTAYQRLQEELADVALTAILAIQHFTKDSLETGDIVSKKLNAVSDRMKMHKIVKDVVV